MSENSKIEWTDHTFNPWEGCTKVGAGCDHCYAEVRNARYSGGQSINWGAGAPRRRTSESNWNLPIKWNANADIFFAENGRRQRVFCASLADVFDNEVDPSWRYDLFNLIEQTPNIDWLLLTKRIGNADKMIRDARLALVGSTRLVTPEVLPNLWLGATVVNQIEADRDIPKLLNVSAAVRFLSIEPLLGNIDLKLHTTHNNIHWVIVGGESGNHARPMHPAWPRNLRDQCAAVGVPFLFKQWGEWVDGNNVPKDAEAKIWFDKKRTVFDMRDLGLIREFSPGYPPGKPYFACNYNIKVGKHAAGRLLDGVFHDGYPISEYK